MTAPTQCLHLPSLLREMAEAHGLPVALRFAEMFGGQYLYMPATARPDHPVARTMGAPVLAWLIERHDPMARIVVPMGPARRALVAAAVQDGLDRGLTAGAIAAELRMHVRDVQRWKARLRNPPVQAQADFFGRRR